MPDIHLESIIPAVSQRIHPFIEEVLSLHEENIHSMHITGSAVTDDFDEKRSLVSSIVVLKQMDLRFIELIAPLGKKYGKKRVAAPLIMTPGYIESSLDVFPLEFLDFRLIHHTVYGEDILSDIAIGMADLRHQCEREIKVKLIGLRQGYISSQGDNLILTGRFVESITGYMSLFRGIIYLMGKEPPVRRDEVISALSESTGINLDIFGTILDLKKEILKLKRGELDSLFENYYMATEKLGDVIDALQV